MSKQKPRARDLGIPFEGIPGEFNAITDVAGIEVGYSTIISEDPKIRTGVTAILPRGKHYNPVFAGWHALNGNGEMTGTTWITESGFLETPIMITNTNSVGTVRDSVLKWFVETGWYKEENWYTYPVVAETYDGILNDIYGFHVKEKHVYEALNNARSGNLQEGNTGGGTGMRSFGFKAGTGTASRLIHINEKTYTVGTLVQSNFGEKKHLTIAGVPVGKEISNLPDAGLHTTHPFKEGDGSIVVVVATDAPLLPHQLKRIATRVSLGIGAVGGYGNNGSGDIFITFSTANPDAFHRQNTTKVEQLSNDAMNPLFEATAQSVEEAIINAMIAAETMEGHNGSIMHKLPQQQLLEILKNYNRISPIIG
ncbi:P1 family peptidase [Chryseobacterium oranimense]|uniref:DmpA family aminopeptidase n=1 Tax=Chryseobacterium oranimense TaxID=421058 RepID=UPI0021AFB1AF|nr:P1 family peptidase [Chryseobacterium oranimense]UWX61516.1 P1 family peptidase [Chryseobacterium oranimense]